MNTKLNTTPHTPIAQRARPLRLRRTAALFSALALASVSLCVIAPAQTVAARATDLHEAVFDGQIAEVRALLAANPAAVHARNSLRDTPLHIAVRRGDTLMVGVLIEQRADLNALNGSSLTPLRLARGLGRTEIAALLDLYGAKAYPFAPNTRQRSKGGRVLTQKCGSCEEPVSAYAEKGDDCPHCQVRWTDLECLEVEAESSPAPLVTLADILSAASAGPELASDAGFEAFAPVTPARLPLARAYLPPGPNVVRVHNPNPSAAQLGLRCGVYGANFYVPPRGVNAVNVPGGRYDVFFIFSDRPHQLYQGDSFNVIQHPMARQTVNIHLTATPNGNYSVRPVN